jgi:hypothetical protein
VNIVAGRATFTDGLPKLYAYVHREVTSAAARLDQFLWRNGVAINERVTVISDDAGEFAKTVEGSQLARGRILDWFHIAMKFQAAQRSVFGSKMIDSMERELVETEITHAKQGFGVDQGTGQSTAGPGGIRIQNPVVESEYCLQSPGEQCAHVGQLVNYSARHRKGLPISSSIAESAVNQVVSYRMAKKRQMRWTDEGRTAWRRSGLRF